MIDLTIKKMVPLLTVHDVRRSIAFYRDVLGFELTGQYPDPSDDPGFATFRKGSTEIMMNSDTDSSKRTDATDIQRSQHVGFHFWTEDVEGLRASLQEHDVNVGDIKVQYFGMKQLSVKDPDGYGLVFQEEEKS